ncbi:aspartyl-phosphate phosphatase Spo0E family protein [Fervidibacillus albus]|uniref:aspartyl-phosphate phosphatase Spo0E family protein n=1 Tax=Fervidibacillus albus TaxID=2980026 RepID=UPI003B84A296
MKDVVNLNTDGSHIIREIENQRKKMNNLYKEEGYISHNVLKVSQELDKFIFEYQKKYTSRTDSH